MKKPAQNIVFYPNKMEAWGWLGAAFLYGGMIFALAYGLPLAVYIAAAVFAFFFLGSMKKMFFPATLCTLTPLEVRFNIHKKSAPYKDIISFHTRLEPSYASAYGLRNLPVRNLGFRIFKQGLYIFPAHRLSDKDYTRLVQELKKQNIPYTKEEFDLKSSFPFARFFNKRKK